MAVYVLRDGRMVDKATGEPMVTGPWVPTVPMVVSDVEGYRSPVTGEWIEGRRARRDDLKRHNCVEYEPSLSPVKPERFGAKRKQRGA